MREPIHSHTSSTEPMVTEATAQFARTNKSVLEFMFGTQKMLLDEIVFTSSEILDRTRTETHLLSDFVSKMAESHSVKDLRTVFQQCTQHQIDFLCRDSERLFRHGGRTLEAASNLLARGVQS